MSNYFRPHGLYGPWNFPGQNTGVGSLSFLQGIFPTQGSNPGLSHCRWILYQLSHKGNPRILDWVTYPSSGDLPDPGIKLESPTLQVDSLLTEPPGNPRNTGVGISPFSKGSSWPRNQTGVSGIAGGFFTSWATREATKEENADILTLASNAVAHISLLLEISSISYSNAVYPSRFMPSGKTSLTTPTYVGPSFFSSFILSSSFLKTLCICLTGS